MNELTLQPKLIEETIAQLLNRIDDRFPGAGLGKVCHHLLLISRAAEQKSRWLGRPVIWLRMVAFIVIGLILAGTISQLYFFDWKQDAIPWSEFVQGMEAATNELVLIGASIFFLITLETRFKRSRGLKAIHELRSIAHIIDMHQLTKDPERALSTSYQSTKSSPKVKLDGFQLRRYLDYCSEMLSLTGKVAAEYVNDFDDAVMVSAVNEVETLTADFSRKIWQKIMILHSFDLPPAPGSTTPQVTLLPAPNVEKK
jgi:hypothetical protein